MGFGPIGSAPIGAWPEKNLAGSVKATQAISIAYDLGDEIDIDIAAELWVRHDIDTSSPAPAPPESGERLLCYLLPVHRRNEILGDLAEDYRTNFLPKYGPREARRMYWAHFIRSVAATVPPWLWAAILGVLGWLWSKLGS